MKKVALIGSGFSSLSAACYLAKAGYDVTVFEKNGSIGGRAQQLVKDGFKFDMGPSWYWMPDVFERFFADFDKTSTDFYSLEKLAPAYEIYFGTDDKFTVDDSLEAIAERFEAIEKGAGAKLMKYIEQAKENYEIAIHDLVYKPGESLTELVKLKTIKKIHQFASTISKDVRSQFKDDRLRKVLEFPALFLGAKASKTPSFYNFMNYADFGMGTWYPKGGMYSVVQGMFQLAISLGVDFKFYASVDMISVNEGTVDGIFVHGEYIPFDLVVSGADYAHTESLMPEQYRQYSKSYWNSKTYAPSSLLFYLGFDKKIPNMTHHSLFFDADFEKHAQAIYDRPSYPKDPLFYASFPSINDETIAPEGKEAGVILIPLAPGMNDDQVMIDSYFDQVMDRLEAQCGTSIRDSIVFKKQFTISDFVKEYNSYKGNAYGMANTLFQTAALRPKLKSKKLEGMFFTGQLTVPGPGVPPSLISGKLVADLVAKYHPLKKTKRNYSIAASL
jgi:phytoene desaturase